MQPHLQQRRERLASAWALRDELVLIGAGEPPPIPGGQDQHYRFLAHSEYFYLTDEECPGGVVAFDPRDGWLDFAPEVTELERLWEGRTHAPGQPLTQLAGWLAGRRGRSLVMLGSPPLRAPTDAGRVAELRAAFDHVRRSKDEIELARIGQAVAATITGFAAARAHMRPGVSERALQIEIETAFYRAGADRTAYDTIVGAGSNAAVLHFSPSSRALAEGELVLIDAGAEVRRYCADVTRTYPVGAGFSAFQRELYEVVLRTEERAIERCRVGVEYRDVHMGACRDIAEGLVQLGLLRGAPDALVERDAHALFFPHGVGHMVGLGVRDASGYLPGRTRSTRPGLSALRTDLPLEAGFVMTIEPGVYFVPALLNNADRRQRYADCVDWARVDTLLNAGGVRIEDNILITEAGPKNLTCDIPKRY